MACEGEDISNHTSPGRKQRNPRENIKELNGKPLMAYTIEEALKCPEIDRVVVSTDSKEIAQVAEKYGAEVPFMRPAQLAADTSKTIDAVWDVLDRLEEDYEYVVLLQPTSPSRLAEDITGAIQKAVETGKDVVSVSKVQDPPVLMRQMDENGELTPLLTEGSTVRRQDMKPWYRVNVERLTKTTSLNDNPAGYEIPRERSLDIDEPEDFELASYYLGKRILVLEM